MIYKLTIECASKEIAENIQAWADKCYHSDEIFWNAITEIPEEEDKELEDYQHQLDMADDYASREY